MPAKRDLRHLQFSAAQKNIEFTRFGRGNENIPSRSESYFEEKKREIEYIKKELKEKNKPFTKILRISGQPGKDLLYESLDNADNLRLLSIKEFFDENGQKGISANVQFKNEKAYDDFVKKLYRKKQTRLCQSIEKIEMLKNFEDLVTDFSIPEGFISSKRFDWIEIWLLDDEDMNDENMFYEFIEHIKKNYSNIVYNPTPLVLGDRTVALIKANSNILNFLCQELSYIAEIRFAKRIKHFLKLDQVEQTEFVENLISRTSINKDIRTISVILDTGVNRGHPLLKEILPESRVFSIEQISDTYDGWKDKNRKLTTHGTAMAGLSVYGDLQYLLSSSSNQEIRINHGIASIKILPDQDISTNLLWHNGKVVQEAVDIANKNTGYSKNYVLALTCDSALRGLPSSYSTTFDVLIYKDKSLFLVSTGNCILDSVSMAFDKDDYIKHQQSSFMDDPAQSWNALTVGAYTEKVDCSNIERINNEEVKPLAYQGDVSPYSQFSMLKFEKDNFPIKPEVLFEGGNMVIDPEHGISPHEYLDLLTTNPDFQKSGDITHLGGTSAAAALAGRFSSILMNDYPEYWPETIRGLMVHSADWTETMKEKRLEHKDLTNEKNKVGHKVCFLRQCGFGVPDLQKALRSGQNSLTLISQNELQLFDNERKHQCVYFDLPWPKESLDDNEIMTLKVTLSYFISPKAGSRGNQNKFQYQSHGLRFNLKKKDETKDAFFYRVNKATPKEGKVQNKKSTFPPIEWSLGERVRNRIAGTLIKDIWEGKAVELASMDTLIVYPVGGWWKWDKRNIPVEESQVRFSLIVDIETQAEIDLYNKIKVILDTRIPVPTPIDTS